MPIWHPYTESPAQHSAGTAPIALIAFPAFDESDDQPDSGDLVLAGLYMRLGGTWRHLETDEEPDAPYWWCLERDVLEGLAHSIRQTAGTEEDTHL